MAGSWLRGVVGVSLTLCVAGQALAAEGKVTVFAAASLTNAMQDIAGRTRRKNVEVVSSFASSSTLARQIEAGAPADLFISADQKWMDYAADKRPSFRQPAPLCLATARWWSRRKPVRRGDNH